MNNYQKSFYFLFLFSLLIVFSPLKSVAYLLPFLYLFFLILRKKEKVEQIIFGVILVLVALVFYNIAYDYFLIGNYLFSIITYSSFFVVLIDERYLTNKVLYEKILRIIIIVFIIEGLIGTIQGVEATLRTGFGGDAVEGTLHLPFYSEGKMTHQMFTANMIIIFLFSYRYFISNFHRYNVFIKIGYLLGILSFVISTVMHMILFLLISVIMSHIITKKNKDNFTNIIYIKRIRKYALFILPFILIAGSFFIIDRIPLISQYSELAIKYYDKFPRSKITIDTFDLMFNSYPSSFIIGLGPGQYVSRASLILSGEYLGQGEKEIPFIKNSKTAITKSYVMPLLYFAQSDRYFWGSTGMPFYSILSIVSEFGIIIVLFIISQIIVVIRKIKRQNLSNSFHIIAALVFLILLGFQENYFEYPQIILINLLLIKLSIANGK